MSGPKTISFANASSKNESVLIFLSDTKFGEDFEARTEFDPVFARQKVYFASDLSSAKEAIRKYSISLCIYDGSKSDLDFVFVQNELRASSGSVELIPLLGVPSISQLSESKRIGGLHTYGDVTKLSYDYLKSLIIEYFRHKERSIGTAGTQLEKVKTIQHALLSNKDAKWIDAKDLSKEILDEVIVDFDFSIKEVSNILGAEQIFFPDISLKSYELMLSGEFYDMLSVLKETGSWDSKTARKPTGPAGLVVSVVNFISMQLLSNADLQMLVDEIAKRPDGIKHPALRYFTEERIRSMSSLASYTNNRGNLRIAS